MADVDSRNDGSDEEEGEKGRTKSRRELPAGAVATLKAWLLSPEHFTHPYPTPQDQVMLMQKTGIDKKQLKNWFTNARRRIWKPMLKKQLEQGKLTAAGAGGGGVAVPGVVPGLMVPTMSSGMDGQIQYQQSLQHGVELQHQVQLDQYGNPMYTQQASAPHSSAPPPSVVQTQYYEASAQAPSTLPLASSIASLPQMNPSTSGQHLSKTDSHAVLMELFARDQDLVRQATESAVLKKPQEPIQAGQNPVPGASVPSQHPMKTSSQGRLANVPTLNSWPHFSSVSSLNNLGTMPGVKSITSLSQADLAKQGPVNTIGNLAQVKSLESMGRNDSYAFLEVFFGDKSSTNLNQMASKDAQRGVKREREEDNDVGLSLEDESPATNTPKKDGSAPPQSSDINTTPFGMEKVTSESTGTLKRAYDDALAARGLMSVSRSSEKLTDLALPPKIQRTLSQEFMRQEQEKKQRQALMAPSHTQQYAQYQYSAGPASSDPIVNQSTSSQQYPGQHPGQQVQTTDGVERRLSQGSKSSDANGSIEVPSATKCAICHQPNVDTQLRPCGHMFHESCLKPTLQAPMGPPKCPIDHTPIQSALLAIPTDENCQPRPMHPQPVAWSAPPVPTGESVSKR